MPIYEYECEKCNKRFEVFQKITDPPLTSCECGQTGGLKKLISNTSFILKGSGWYATDYPSESRKKAMESREAPSALTEAKKDASELKASTGAAESQPSKSETPVEKSAAKTE
jgi:putative FmdB family regulatory protein